MKSKDSILTTIREHKPQLASFGISRIGLFGSYVRNEQRPQSDIDILVDFAPEKETFDNFMDVSDCLEDLFTGERVEVVTVNGLSPYLGHHILKEVTYANVVARIGVRLRRIQKNQFLQILGGVGQIAGATQYYRIRFNSFRYVA